MEGLNEPSELKGIIPNTFEHIFDHIALNGSKDKYLVRASYFEIYNEEIKDLLLSKPQTGGLELKESADSGVYVKDLTSTVVKSVDEIDTILQKGKKNRSVGATLMNAGSSRSHSVFTIIIECCSTDESQNEHIRVGKLNLVDLAGSERQSKTGATGDRLKEATKINLSLSALGNVISALVDGKSQHVPYRDSKLTRILQDSLGGNTKTVMCANAGPADYNYDESLSTLRYANRAKNIKNKPVINEDPKDAMLREYQEEIARLKERLSQMPSISSSSDDAIGNKENESILNESCVKVSKECEKVKSKTKAETDKLRTDSNQTAEEREKLRVKLEEEQKARLDTENQRLELRRQLDEMEAKLMTGGEIANNAAKQEAALRKANQELIAKQETELALTRKMNEQDEEKLHLEEQFSSLADEVASKTKKLKKVFARYQQAKAEIIDLEHESLADKNELLKTIRDLTKQLKLKEFVISSFIPPQYALAYDSIDNGGRAVYDESRETWSISRMKVNGFNAARDRRVGTSGLRRPEIEYARRRKMVDPNLRWHSEDVVELDIAMPTRSTPDFEDPNTASKIAAILAMDLNDPMEELPRKKTSNRASRFLSLNGVSNLCTRVCVVCVVCAKLTICVCQRYTLAGWEEAQVKEQKRRWSQPSRRGSNTKVMQTNYGELM